MLSSTGNEFAPSGQGYFGSVRNNYASKYDRFSRYSDFNSHYADSAYDPYEIRLSTDYEIEAVKPR